MGTHIFPRISNNHLVYTGVRIGFFPRPIPGASRFLKLWAVISVCCSSIKKFLNRSLHLYLVVSVGHEPNTYGDFGFFPETVLHHALIV